MSNQNIDPDLAGQISGLRDGKIRYAAPNEILDVVRSIIDGVNEGAPSVDSVLRNELEDLADYIQLTKAEIMTLAPEDIQDEHLPLATVELDAIVRATEEATNDIMEAAEQIESVAEKIGGEQSEALVNATTSIFEACGFQDITGQRIGKVIKALKEVETKVEAIITAFGDGDEEARDRRRRERQSMHEIEHHKALVEGSSLEGPQLPEKAVKQDEIDALFSNLD